MKFQKFVKSIGTKGIVYVRKNGERWLASQDVFMKIPNDIQSITASEVKEMPDTIESIINSDYFTAPCELHDAIMTCADGAIKDCVRIYATQNALCKIPISNSAYSLIERKDVVEMYIKFDSDTEEQVAKALFVKRFPVGEDEETIGVIFPAILE